MTTYNDLPIELQAMCDAMKMNLAERAEKHASEGMKAWHLQFQFRHPDVAEVCAAWSKSELGMRAEKKFDRDKGEFIVTFVAENSAAVRKRARAYSARVNS